MEEKIEKFKELMEAKSKCQFCLDNATGSADMHGLVLLGRESREIERGGIRAVVAKPNRYIS